MGDIGDMYNELREHRRKVADKREQEYEPMLEKAGAMFMTLGVYRLGDFDCYPRRGYARNYRTNERTSIEKVIKYDGIADDFPKTKKK